MKKVFINKKILSFGFAIGMIAASVLSIVPVAEAAINKQINYQGKLTSTSDVAVADGSYNIRYKLYTVASGGSPIWTETRCYSPDSGATCDGTGTDQRAELLGGLFSSMLGSVASLDAVNFNQTLYLGVEIGGSGATPVWDGEMTPRKVLGTVPAAFETDRIDGLSSEQFLRTDAQNATSSASTFFNVLQTGAGKIAEFFGQASQSVLSILSSGNVGVGTTTPAAKLSVDQGSATAVGEYIAGFWNATADLFRISTSTPTATSTAFVIAATGKVGIGTSTPSTQLSVSGNALFSGTLSLGSLAGATSCLQAGVDGIITRTGSACGSGGSSIGDSKWATSTLNSLAIYPAGGQQVGIGTTSPWALLSVNGTSTQSSYIPLFVIATSTGSATSTAFIIDGNGKVGIGTTTPGTTLGVQGTLSASSLATYDTTATSTFAGGLSIANGGLNMPDVVRIYQDGHPLLLSDHTSFNLFLGYDNGFELTTGTVNTGIGYKALNYLTSGTDNTALGEAALNKTTSGNYNTAIGMQAGHENVIGSGLTALGFHSSYYATSTSYDTSVGYAALFNNIVGGLNVAVGASSMNLAIANYQSVGVGYGTLYNNTAATNTTAIGFQAGFGAAGYSNQNNTLVGFNTGYALTTGGYNTYIGQQAGSNMTSGNFNIIIGANQIDAPVYSGSNQLDIGNLIYGTGLDGTGQTLSAGKVGIATATPVSTLHVGGTTALNWNSSGSYGLTTIGTSGTEGSSLWVNTPSLNSTFSSGLGIDGTYGAVTSQKSVVNIGAYGVKSPSGYSSDLSFLTTAEGVAREVLRLDSNANVGIGTTSPWAKLSVAALSSNTAPLFTLSTSTASATSTAFIIDGNGKVGIGTTSPYAQLSVSGLSASGKFNADNANATSTFAGGFLVATGGGNFGIGTSTPEEKLEVNGRLALTSGSDFGPLRMQTYNSTFLGVLDPTFEVGYNVRNGVRASSTLPAVWMSMEANYANNTLQATQQNYSEWYITGLSTSSQTFRPIAFTWDNGDINRFAAASIYISSNKSFDVLKTTDGSQLLSVGGDGALHVTKNINFPNANPWIQTAVNTPIAFIANGLYTWASNVVEGFEFGSARDTNLYRSAANTLRTNDSLLVDANLGIGTTSPWALLSVNGTSTQSSYIPLFVIATSTGSATSTAFIIDSNGKVGIGTTTPGTDLATAGVSSASSYQAFGANATSTFSNLTATGNLTAKTGRSATFVVAASNASSKMKAQADYVADGTDDQIEINAAIQALPSVGGKVLLSEGSFSISAPVVINRDHVILEGAGAGTPAGSSFGGGDAGDPSVTGGPTRLNLTAGFTGSYAVDTTYSAATRIVYGVELKNFGIMGISAVATVTGINWQVVRGRIDNVFVQYMTGDGLYSSAGGDSTTGNDSPYDSIFTNVRLRNNTGNGAVFDNVSTDHTWIGAIIDNNGGDGIKLFGSNGSSAAHMIHDSYIYSNSGKGIEAKSWQLKVYDTRIQDNGTGGIYITGTVTDGGGFEIVGGNIRNNSVAADNTYDGINIAPSSAIYGGLISDIDFTADDGLSNTSHYKQRYGISIETSYMNDLVIGITSQSRKGASYTSTFGTGLINDQGTNTKIMTPDQVKMLAGSLFTTKGSVGVGTSSPWALLSISTTTNNTLGTPLFTVATTSTRTAFHIDSAGNVGVGTAAPTHSLTFSNTSLGTALYNTADQTTNYERLVTSWTGNVARISAEYGGSGSARVLRLCSANQAGIACGTTLDIQRSAVPFFNITPGSTGSIGNWYQFGGTTVASAGVMVGLAINPTVTQTSTAGYTALLVNPTETALGSGNKRLMDLQVGSVSKFMVDNLGKVGVGTTSPYSKLSVWGAGTGSDRLFELTNSASTTLAAVLENGTSYFLGNVGIGTTSPYAPLSVVGAGGVVADKFTATSTTATSTFANGINITGGCYAVNGTCIGYTVKLAAIYSTSTPGTNVPVVFTGAQGSAPSFAAGAPGTLTLPSNTSYYVVEGWGGGGGGGSSGANNNGSAVSGDTCYGTNSTACTTPNFTAGGGGLGGNSTSGAAGAAGSATGGDLNINGNPGQPGTGATMGGAGGSSPRGGGGGFAPIAGSTVGSVGNSPGGGGSGGRASSATNIGAGGGGGGYSNDLVTNTTASYYTVGVGGLGGTTSIAGGNGAAGAIVISVYATSSLTSAGNDYAEMFPVGNPLIGAGDIVSVDFGVPVQMKLAKIGDVALAGVISTEPGQVLGDKNAVGQRPVALSGRVPTKVNLEGGDISIGDRITPSSVPGVGKRASSFEDSVGIALQNYTSSSQGDTIMTFINIQRGIDIDKLSSILLSKWGLTIATSTLYAYQDAAATGEEVSTPADKGISILMDLLDKKEGVIKKTELNDIYTDRVTAGLEVVAPRVIADTLVMNTLQPVDKDITINLSSDGKFIIGGISSAASSTASGDTSGKVSPTSVAISFDNSGNAFFAGDLTAKSVRADRIIGLDLFASRLSSFEEELQSLVSTSTSNSTNIAELLSLKDGLGSLASTTENIGARLLALENLVASTTAEANSKESLLNKDGGLTIEGLSIFKGGLMVNSIGSQEDVVSILSDTIFIGRPYFTVDTAGFAKINKGDSTVQIDFEKEYIEKPIVNATMSLDSVDSVKLNIGQEEIFVNDIRFVVVNASTTGFTILINKPAPSEITFNWTAFAVKNAKTFTSKTKNDNSVPLPPPSSAVGGAGEPGVSASTSTPPVVTENSTSTPDIPALATSTPDAVVDNVETPVDTSTTTVNQPPETNSSVQKTTTSSSTPQTPAAPESAPATEPVIEPAPAALPAAEAETAPVETPPASPQPDTTAPTTTEPGPAVTP